jgi:hypothetical protein
MQTVHAHVAETGQSRRKMISTMAHLKNCCLGGLKAGTEREGRQSDKEQEQVVEFNPIFPFFSVKLIMFISIN